MYPNKKGDTACVTRVPPVLQPERFTRMGLPRRCLAAFQRCSGAGSFYLRDSPAMQACPFGARSTISCASLPTTRSIDVGSLGERPHRVKRGKPKMGADSTPRHNPRPDIRKPLRISNHPFVGAKYFSSRHRPLVARNRLTISAPHHLWHGRKIFRPYARHWWRVTT